ncbi:uncharacterized protein LOC108742902 [Agrilus planipennis]|uniref:Uncharacterized protein LOC108742902 n=1 Tax=Agrilus planipennis TaxID=224129 RepID=A0A1W4XMQ4_AGRPL|nr:uncharacterized protein LOC108742902 [Agrilus planipennis]
MNSKYLFRYDIRRKKVVNDCTFNPTEILKSETPWLWAINNQYENEDDDEEDNVGKWMIFLGKAHVNSTWNKIKEAIKNGHLWQSMQFAQI